MSQRTLGALWARGRDPSAVPRQPSLGSSSQESARDGSPVADATRQLRDPAPSQAFDQQTDSEGEPQHKRKSSEEGPEQNKRQTRERYATELSRVPQLERPNFELQGAQAICKPCTWYNEEKRGLRGDAAKSVILLNSVDNVRTCTHSPTAEPRGSGLQQSSGGSRCTASTRGKGSGSSQLSY